MKIILIGANGYLARNLINKLMVKHQVFGFVRNKIKNSLDEIQYFETKNLLCLRGDILRIQPNVIINLASSYYADHEYENIDQIIKVEVGLSAHLAEICADLQIYLFQTKSLFQKTLKGSAINLYSASKNARDEIMNYYVICKNLKLINILLGDVYGTNDLRNKLIPNVIEHINQNRTSEFTLGNPNRKFYPIYLEDVINVIEIILSRIAAGYQSAGDYQCFPAGGVSLQKFVDTVQQIATKEKFRVEWQGSVENFRDTKFTEPSDLINVLASFTDLEAGIRVLLNSSTKQAGLIDFKI